MDIGVMQMQPSLWQKIWHKMTGDGPASEMWMDRLQIPDPESPIVLTLMTIMVIIAIGFMYISRGSMLLLLFEDTESSAAVHENEVDEEEGAEKSPDLPLKPLQKRNIKSPTIYVEDRKKQNPNVFDVEIKQTKKNNKVSSKAKGGKKKDMFRKLSKVRFKKKLGPKTTSVLAR